jgi:hypothetical protein
VLIAAIPHGHLPEARSQWAYMMAMGAATGAVCGALIGVVCGGAANALGNVVALARRPTEVLQAILYPEQLVKLGAAVRTRTTTLFEGLFDPAPPAPSTPPARPPRAKTAPVEPAKPTTAPPLDIAATPTPPADDAT